MYKPQNSLRVIYWNADGIGSKQNELLDLVSEMSVDVVAICETRLTQRINLHLPGYACYRKDKHPSGRGQGVAILVKVDIEHLLVHTPETKYLEAIGIKINSAQCSYTIYSVYQSPNLPFLTGDIDVLLHSDNQVLLMGDFNAKHDYWFPGSKNANGNLLYSHFLDHEFAIHAPDQPTLVHYRENFKPSLPDLLLSSNVHEIVDMRTIPALSSNHLPVFFQLQIRIDRKLIQRYNYAKANWTLYRSHLNDKIHLSSRLLETESDIDDAIEQLSATIISAREASVPLVTMSHKSPVLPRKIKRLITSRNRLLRQYQNQTNLATRKSLRTQIKILNNNIRLEITNHNDKLWSEKLKNVDNPGSDLWRLAKSVRSASSANIIPPLKSADGTVVCATYDQCEALASAFQQNMTLTHGWHDEPTHLEIQSVLSVLGDCEAEDGRNFVRPREIWNHIRNLKLRKAPGVDNVPNCLIRNLPQKAIVLLTKIFNASLRLARFPPAWKTAKVIAIRKPGKDGSIPSNYRPISLLPSLGKLFEKLLNDRLLKYTRCKLIHEQFGFRNAHSTVQQLARVTEHVAQNLNLGHHTGMVLLDVEKAFDTVWHDGLIFKLIKFNVPLPLVKIVQSYLRDRTFSVHIGSTSSANRCIPAGVPQGSILGPYLFILYLNDIPNQTRTTLACFADDTACFTSSSDTDLIISRLQLAIEKLCEYFEKWKLKLNAAKTEAVIFSRMRKNPAKKLNIDGYSIPWNNSAKYLGLILDRKLLWTEHIAQAHLKAMKAFSALSPILNRRSHLSSSTKLAIYKTLIRPCITYGCPVWSNTCKTNYQKLQVIQNRALKIAFNTPFKTNLLKLHKKINLPPLFEYVLRLSKHFYSNIDKNHDNKLISGIGNTRPLNGNNRYRYITRLPHHHALAALTSD